MLVEDKRK